jgi:hypothetical protein
MIETANKFLTEKKQLKRFTKTLVKATFNRAQMETINVVKDAKPRHKLEQMTEGTFGHNMEERSDYKKHFIDLILNMMGDESPSTSFKRSRFATGLLWNDPDIVEVEYDAGHLRN